MERGIHELYADDGPERAAGSLWGSGLACVLDISIPFGHRHRKGRFAS